VGLPVPTEMKVGSPDFGRRNVPPLRVVDRVERREDLDDLSVALAIRGLTGALQRGFAVLGNRAGRCQTDHGE